MNKRRIVLYILLVLLFTLYNFYYRPIEGNYLITPEYKNSNAYINNLYKSDEYFKKELLDPDNYYIMKKWLKQV